MEKTMAAFNIDDLHHIFITANMEAMKNCPDDYKSPEAKKAFEAADVSGAFWDEVWIMNASPRNDQDDAVPPILFYFPPYIKAGVGRESSTAEYRCPRCGCDVGGLYIPHNLLQGQDHYCADCGQRIDWQSIEKELRKAKEEGK